MIITNGENVYVVEDLMDGVKAGTCFHANINEDFKLEKYIMESMN